MTFNFIGEVDAVRERQLQYISDVLQERGFNNCDVTIAPVGKPGDNFMANVKRIIVEKDGKTFKMIAKLAPLVRDVMDSTILFKNEHVIYTALFPKFKELQKAAGIPEEEWFRHAECYGTYLEKPHEVILLEDLKESNFEILGRFARLSIDNTKLVLKNFALYHSLSFVLKHQEPEKFDEICSMLTDLNDLPPEILEMRKQFGPIMENEILGILTDEKQKSAFKGTIGSFIDLVEITNQDKGSKYSVIQQGDGWLNNIMFSSEDGKISKCVLVDYQTTIESSPAYDVMYMIFNSTDADERIQYYTEWIDYYYEELDNSLNNYGLKAADVYPRDKLDADMKRYVKVILAISVIITNLIVKDAKEASLLKETMDEASGGTDELMKKMMARSEDTETLFRLRVEGLARSVVELGLL